VAAQLTTYVGLADRDWFNFLNRTAGLGEVNFWQPRVHAFRGKERHL